MLCKFTTKYKKVLTFLKKISMHFGTTNRNLRQNLFKYKKWLKNLQRPETLIAKAIVDEGTVDVCV